LNLGSIVLASSSPRRRRLISSLGVPFSVFEPAVDETLDAEEPQALIRVALRKARAFPGGAVVVAADTTVVCDGNFLGKPTDEGAAFRMLASLRGRTHEVVTAVAVVAPGSERSGYSRTRVTMRDYGDDEIRAYLLSGDPMDKAGAYAIQDRRFDPVAGYEGCYLNVVGFPLCTLVRVLRELGFSAERFRYPAECCDCRAEDRLAL